MRINSARPIRALTAKEQDGLREVLFPAKQPEVFTRNSPDDSPDGLRESNQSKKKRRLDFREKDIARSFYGDMIDLGRVSIAEDSWWAREAYKRKSAIAIYNTIHGISMQDHTLIHELAHVWQYNNVRIEPLLAGATHLLARLIGQTEELYDYNVDRVGDPDRKTFREYSFEEQAAILEDAYLVTVENRPPKHNKDYKDGDFLPDDSELWQLYHLFMYEFEQWHKELQPSSSSSHLDP